jgi:DNA-binding phage protein
MNSHSLAEQVSGLASRVNNLAAYQSCDESWTLMKLQERLSTDAMTAIKLKLDKNDADYQAAIAGLKSAIDFIGEARSQIADPAKGMELIAKAADLVEAVFKKFV